MHPRKRHGWLSGNLARLRKARGLTQQKLADLAGIPRATLASMEHGSNPGLEGVLAVAAALDVGLDELVSAPPERRYFKVDGKGLREIVDDSGRFRARQVSPVTTRGVLLQHIFMAPGCDVRGRPHPRHTQEFFFVIGGVATLRIAGDEVELEPHSLVQFSGSAPHDYINRGDRDVEAFSAVVLTMR